MVAEYDSDSDLFLVQVITDIFKQDLFHISLLEYTQSCHEVNNKS